MTKSVRYYIEKETDDQAVVRSVPVAVPRYVAPESRQARPGRAVASHVPVEAANGRRPVRRAVGGVRVARFVRAAMRRDGRDDR